MKIAFALFFFLLYTTPLTASHSPSLTAACLFQSWKTPTLLDWEGCNGLLTSLEGRLESPLCGINSTAYLGGSYAISDWRGRRPWQEYRLAQRQTFITVALACRLPMLVTPQAQFCYDININRNRGPFAKDITLTQLRLEGAVVMLQEQLGCWFTLPMRGDKIGYCRRKLLIEPQGQTDLFWRHNYGLTSFTEFSIGLQQQNQNQEMKKEHRNLCVGVRFSLELMYGVGMVGHASWRQIACEESGYSVAIGIGYPVRQDRTLCYPSPILADNANFFVKVR